MAASTETPFSASWSATSGLNKAETEDFVSFEGSAYQAMKDDPARTPLFQQALSSRIQAQLKNSNSNNKQDGCTVLDLGTGPFAIFAILAAQAGATRVYAIEADPFIAENARETVRQAGFEKVITIIEGFSTDITLPEKVDVVVAEIIGSIASEEGAYATIRDAGRFLKDPTRPENWIPQRVQTYAAPASYTLHTMFGPPEFDWTKLQGEPVRFNCRDEGLQLLADPVLVEDLDFATLASNTAQQQSSKTKGSGVSGTNSFSFTMQASRIQENKSAFYTNLRSGRIPSDEAAQVATDAAASFTGMAFWPRLILSDSITVNSRSFPQGEHQKSHWQTVLPICSARPIPVQPGDVVQVTTDFSLPNRVTNAPTYKLQGKVVSSVSLE